MGRQYNYIYKKLVNSEDDLIGLIAYGIYKKHKIEFIEQIQEELPETQDDHEAAQDAIQEGISKAEKEEKIVTADIAQAYKS